MPGVEILLAQFMNSTSFTTATSFLLDVHFLADEPFDDLNVFDIYPPAIPEDAQERPDAQVTSVFTSLHQISSSEALSDPSYEPSEEAPRAKKPRSIKAKTKTPLSPETEKKRREEKKAVRQENNRLSAQRSRERKKAALNQLKKIQETLGNFDSELGPHLQDFLKHFPECELTQIENLATLEKIPLLFKKVIQSALQYKVAKEAEIARLNELIKANPDL